MVMIHFNYLKYQLIIVKNFKTVSKNMNKDYNQGHDESQDSDSSRIFMLCLVGMIICLIISKFI